VTKDNIRTIPDLRLSDPSRVLSRVAQIGSIGRTEDGGCSRLAFSEQDIEARDLVASWMRDLGMSVTSDAIGNLIGILPGASDVAPLVIGSHIDTVENGGKYDGVLGVLAGLEVAHLIVEEGRAPERPLWVIAFTNEEGSRFQPDLMGSAVFSGRLGLAEALRSKDSAGSTVEQELARHQIAGSFSIPETPLYGFLELHIEQGPVLEAEEISIGIVTGIQGFRWLQFNFEGEANHAGTTPMTFRHDASLGAAWLVNHIKVLTQTHDGLVGNVGDVRLTPSNINVIPGHARALVDLRHPEQGVLDNVVETLKIELKEAGQKLELGTTVKDVANGSVTQFDARLVDLIEDCANDLAIPSRRLVSGAAHDAQMIAGFAPTAMVFVPSRGGISHNPKEHTSDVHIREGISVLLTVARHLLFESDRNVP